MLQALLVSPILLVLNQFHEGVYGPLVFLLGAFLVGLVLTALVSWQDFHLWVANLCLILSMIVGSWLCILRYGILYQTLLSILLVGGMVAATARCTLLIRERFRTDQVVSASLVLLLFGLTFPVRVAIVYTMIRLYFDG